MVLLWMPSDNLPSEGMMPDIPHLDKLVHFFIFAVLAFLIASIATITNKLSALKSFLLVVIIAFSYSALLETGQLWVEGRSFDNADIITNLAGCIAGSLFHKRMA